MATDARRMAIQKLEALGILDMLLEDGKLRITSQTHFGKSTNGLRGGTAAKNIQRTLSRALGDGASANTSGIDKGKWLSDSSPGAEETYITLSEEARKKLARNVEAYRSGELERDRIVPPKIERVGSNGKRKEAKVVRPLQLTYIPGKVDSDTPDIIQLMDAERSFLGSYETLRKIEQLLAQHGEDGFTKARKLKLNMTDKERVELLCPELVPELTAMTSYLAMLFDQVEVQEKKGLERLAELGRELIDVAINKVPRNFIEYFNAINETWDIDEQMYAIKLGFQNKLVETENKVQEAIRAQKDAYRKAKEVERALAPLGNASTAYVYFAELPGGSYYIVIPNTRGEATKQIDAALNRALAHVNPQREEGPKDITYKVFDKELSVDNLERELYNGTHRLKEKVNLEVKAVRLP
jgi:hypothetical protein